MDWSLAIIALAVLALDLIALRKRQREAHPVEARARHAADRKQPEPTFSDVWKDSVCAHCLRAECTGCLPEAWDK